MLKIIKKRIDREITAYFRRLNRLYHLNSVSGIVFKNTRDFALRQGKRIRPALFIIGYLGYGRRAAADLYKSAVSLELLHDFLLVHDDIIDKSPTRRGKPSMHEIFNRYLSGHSNIKFNGQDLAIVAGDLMYSLALNAFLSIKEAPQRKEKALKKFNESVMYTSIGEAAELLCGLKSIDLINKNDIYKVYDLKTGYYTFAYPLIIGATLAGTNRSQIDALLKYGLYLGRAFQLKDDIIGIFGRQQESGKSNLTDLQEAKKTLLVWQAYRNSSQKDKSTIKYILSKKTITNSDLLKMRALVTASGALNYAGKEIARLMQKANNLAACFKMRQKYKELLSSFTEEMLKL